MIVYTAIYGGYDKAPGYPDTHTHTRHVLITDSTKSDKWEQRIVPLSYSPQRNARRVKILSHIYFPEQEVTIWHGGNVSLRGNLEKLASLADESGIAVLKHEQRNCVYDEAKACIQWGLDSPSIIREQMAWYEGGGYPRNRGLSMCFLMVRKNTPQINTLNKLWWNEVRNRSVRDQLSFDYCCWQLGIIPTTIPGGIYEGPYHKRTGTHLK